MAAQMKKVAEEWGFFNDLVRDDFKRSIAQVPAKGKVVL